MHNHVFWTCLNLDRENENPSEVVLKMETNYWLILYRKWTRTIGDNVENTCSGERKVPSQRITISTYVGWWGRKWMWEEGRKGEKWREKGLFFANPLLTPLNVQTNLLKISWIVGEGEINQVGRLYTHRFVLSSLWPSCPSVDRLVGWSVCHNSLKEAGSYCPMPLSQHLFCQYATFNMFINSWLWFSAFFLNF